MIRLVSRDLVFKNPFAAAVVRPRQDAVRDGGIEDYDTTTGVSGQEDLAGAWCDAPPVIDGHRSVKPALVSWPGGTLSEFEHTFPDKLASVLQTMGMQEFYLLLSLRTDWFMQQNDYPPAKEALETLYRFTFRKPYHEAYFCGASSLPLLSLTAFRLARYCAALPEALFVSAHGDFAFNICRYGNFHLEMGQSVHDVFTEFLKSGFVPLDGEETERFEDGGAVEGREIIV